MKEVKGAEGAEGAEGDFLISNFSILISPLGLLGPSGPLSAGAEKSLSFLITN